MTEGPRLSHFPLCQRILWDGDLKLVFNGFDCASSVHCMSLQTRLCCMPPSLLLLPASIVCMDRLQMLARAISLSPCRLSGSLLCMHAWYS